jgi:hypothetical protein
MNRANFRMRSSFALVVALIVASSLALGAVRPAHAAGSDWPALARRIAASHPFAPANVALGAEPPGFAFLPNARPALKVLGSTWPIVLRGGPESVHVYYAPSPRTTAAAAALVAKLEAAGYAQIPETGFPDGFVGEYGPVHFWCPAQRRGATILINVENVDGMPALDVQFFSYASTSLCSLRAPDVHGARSPVPALGNIPGLTIYARTRMTEAGGGALGSVAMIRTMLPAAEAVAKLAERFTANGWTARTPVVDGTTIVQHFARTEASRRWDALLLFEPHSDGDHLYDAVLDVRRVPLAAADR